MSNANALSAPRSLGGTNRSAHSRDIVLCVVHPPSWSSDRLDVLIVPHPSCRLLHWLLERALRTGGEVPSSVAVFYRPNWAPSFCNLVTWGRVDFVTPASFGR